jgi:DNA-binding XRE family transcriptional regulator
MKHRDYVTDREARDPSFKKARDAGRPQFEFRRALIGARLAAGLTQAELAEQIGTKQSAIARLENGASNPTLDMLVRLAKALSVSFEITPDASVEMHEHSG